MITNLRSAFSSHTLLPLYRTLIRAKLDYGFIDRDTTSENRLQQFNSVHN